MPSHADEEKEGKSCCTWPKIAVLAVVAVVSGILIWKFAPIDQAINSVLPTFNNTASGSGSTPIGAVPPTPAPTPQPTYQFNRCQDPTSTGCCNGLDSICDLGVDDILYATMHNAMATFDDGFLFGPSHVSKLEGALAAGYRGINLDVCNCNGVYQFCHGICDYGARGVEETLTSINLFLDNNPNEVLVIPLELNSEVGSAIDIDELYEYMQLSSGFVDKLYVHENMLDEWPTLRELIELNTRVLLFHHRGPDCDEENICPPGLHYYYSFATDTPWKFGSVNEIEATNTSCAFRNNSRPASQTFHGLNSFITPPDQSKAKNLNSLTMAKTRLETCSALNGNLNVNFVYADFWSEGDLPQLTQEHNAALAARRKRQLRLSR